MKDRFWKDTWLGNSPLAQQYPSLYNIATSCTVLPHPVELSGECHRWNRGGIRPQLFRFCRRFMVLSCHGKALPKETSLLQSGGIGGRRCRCSTAVELGLAETDAQHHCSMTSVRPRYRPAGQLFGDLYVSIESSRSPDNLLSPPRRLISTGRSSHLLYQRGVRQNN
jgi:hypothetical protein